ncbi:MAG: glycine cleavage system aminomethyltransferase GcvT [Actinomycetota bacterium]|nr:glycine cleavage system aminomethyltransferase GcvT [Actinomycetota bacterium]
MSDIDSDSGRQTPPTSTHPEPGTPEAADAPFDELLSPLHELHVEAGAQFTDFAGWQMPVRYSSDLAEHHAVRTAAGLFDLSHMAEILVFGPEAAEALDYALAGKLSAIAEGQAKYSLLLARDGGILDDLVVYRTGDDRYLVVANASNRALVATELRDRCSIFDCLVEDESDEIALIAIQGPISEEVLRNVEGFDVPGLDGLKYYRAIPADFRGHNVLVARTGYTGEDGFEFYLGPVAAAELWVALLETGGGSGLIPAGLAARDTLRLEAGMPLYGHELGTDTFPVQAGLGKVVALSKEGDFVGRAAVEDGPVPDARVLVGLVADGRRAGRAGYSIVLPESAHVVGAVTSGALSPTLGVPISLAYVDPDYAAVGTMLHLDVRGTRVPASVVALPFYSRKKSS